MCCTWARAGRVFSSEGSCSSMGCGHLCIFLGTNTIGCVTPCQRPLSPKSPNFTTRTAKAKHTIEQGLFKHTNAPSQARCLQHPSSEHCFMT
ncbi:hypothetical protein FIBSPDRAFT_208597 [Athelia psychrophila]|uniref:Uncharacterized protein n=1 Tax=Athelia psychrophila TaxID=1759441 RepID=A0A166WNN3_9AGAM|nr:hypothetical protein FIBSPDRAFT_208597 [Fibularhizoctonia sp. CBS 109695]